MCENKKYWEDTSGWVEPVVETESLRNKAIRETQARLKAEAKTEAPKKKKKLKFNIKK